MDRLSKEQKIAHGVGQSVDNCQQVKIPARILRHGSIVGRTEISLGDKNNTKIYVSPGANIAEIRKKYLEHMNVLRFIDPPDEEDDTME